LTFETFQVLTKRDFANITGVDRQPFIGGVVMDRDGIKEVSNQLTNTEA
jgi:hypothetical protein